MGGIAGLVHFRGSPPERSALERMSAAMAHRGPDRAGLWLSGAAGMVQRRLARGSAHPCEPTTRGPLVLALDGRLFDADPVAPGERSLAVTGPPQAELAAEAWDRRGSDCLPALRGDFALAVWKGRDRVLHLVRDRAGAKPLYYAWHDGRFAFASDVRALLSLPWVSRELAHEELAEYLSFRYTHAPRTLLRDVRQLPAAHLARVDATGVRLQRYWSPRWCPPGAPDPPEDEAVAALDAALELSIGRRLAAGGPFGLLLSGGAASASIAAMVCRHHEPPRTYHVSFADGGQDEAGFAGRIARLLGAPNRVVRLERQDFVEAIDPVVRSMGEPVPSPAAVTLFLLCREVRDEVRMLLSGNGGDELLGGQRVATLRRELRVARAVSGLPGPARGLLARAARPAGLDALAGDPAAYGLARGIGGSNVFDLDERMALLRDPAQVRPGMRRTMLEPLYNEVHSDPVNQVLHVYMRGWLPEDTLMRSDRVSMEQGIEVRYPLLDQDVVALCATWPGWSKVKRRRGRWYSKWPLRLLAASHDLPPAIIWRPKRGMPAPLNRWLRGPGEPFLWERVASVCEDPLGLFRPGAVRELALRHARGEAENGAKLWTLFFLDLWWRSLGQP